MYLHNFKGPSSGLWSFGSGAWILPKRLDRLGSILVFLLFIAFRSAFLLAFRPFPVAIEKGAGSIHIYGVDEVPH